MKPNKQETPQQILKKVERQTAQQKKNKVMEMLTAKSSTNKQYERSFFDIFKLKTKQNWIMLNRKLRVSQNKSLIVMTAFLVFSTFMCWKIESKFDIMRSKANKSQSYKQKAVERQNQYINQMLSKTQFQSVPISNKKSPKITYKFQDQDGDIEMDTKQDILEIMAKDYKNGLQIDLIYEQQLRKKNMI